MKCWNSLVPQFRQLVIFGLVGVAATATHYLVAVGSVELLGFALQLSNFFGFLAAFIVSFLGQSYLTFQAKPHVQMLMKYFLLACFNYCFSAMLLHVLTKYSSAGHRITLLVTVLFIPIFTFLVSKKYIFKNDV